MKKDQIIAIVLALLVITTIASVVFHYEGKLEQARDQQDASRSEAEIFRNKYNESVAERAAFEGDRSQLQEEIAFWKTQGDTLRSKITASTKEITLLKQALSFKATGKPTVVYPASRDTVIFTTSTANTAPTYKIDTANRWIAVNVAVSADRYDLQIAVKELDLELITETKRQGLFGRKYTNIRAISRNPYVENKDIKTVTITEKRPMIGKALIAVAGVLVGVLIK